jgi:hypothetical protein
MKSAKHGAKTKSALSIVRKFYPNVNKVVDATEGKNISVTKRDCNAQGKDHNGCALAKAIQRGGDGAIVSLTIAYIVEGKKVIIYLTNQTF